jgi:tight adherence protein B
VAVTFGLAALALLAWPPSGSAPSRLAALAGADRLVASQISRRWVVGLPPAWIWWSAAIVALLGSVPFGRVGVGLAAALLVVAAGRLVAAIARGRATAARTRALSQALRILCAELAAGSRAPAALQAAAIEPFAPAFRAAAVVAADGGDVAAALSDGPDELHAIAGAWRVVAQTGAGLAGVLGQVESDLRRRLDLHRAVETALAGPRSSAALLALLPLFGLLLGTAMGARPFALLVGPPAGQALLGAGVLLDVAGLAWTARLIARARR